MPRAQGLIPLEGNVKTCVDCCSSVSIFSRPYAYTILYQWILSFWVSLQICMMSLNSSIYKDMRVIRISSNYVLGNMTDCELCVATLAVPNSLTDLCLPIDLSSASINIAPSIDQR